MRRFFVFTLISILIALLSPVSAMAGGKLEGRVVALDAGHGGSDVGALNPNPANRLNESDMNISVVNLLKQKLETDGAQVILTRTDNNFIGLHERVAVANAANAQILISVHQNSANPDVNGTESYYTQPDDLPLANSMQARMLQNFKLRDRGVKYISNFVLTNRPNMPSTITEGAFVTNDSEADSWLHSDRAEQQATALYQGTVDYFASH